MKKLIAVLLAVSICFSLAGCKQDTPPAGGGTGGRPAHSTEEQQETPRYDVELYALLEKLVETVQPGTAGSSLKAVYAAKDLLDWVKENRPQPQTVADTVAYFYENSGLAEEAARAFGYIRDVFTSLLESDTAKSLLDMVGMAIEDFEVPQEVTERIDNILTEAEKYYNEHFSE